MVKKFLLLVVFSLLVIPTVLAGPVLNYESPTPSNNSYVGDVEFVEINVSIAEQNLCELKYNWDGSNYFIFNDSLKLMMNFDNVSSLGESNTHVFDVSENGFNGTVMGSGLPTSDGKYSGGFDFDGTDGYITTNYGDEVNTISFWFKTNDLDTFKGLFGQRYDSIEESGNWQMHWGNPPTNSNKLRIYAYGSGGNGDGYSLVTNTNFSVDQWYHVTVTSELNSLKYYVNGAFDIEYTNYDMVLGAGENDDILVMGGSFGNTNLYPFNGTIDEVKVWDRVLTSEEVYQLYTSNLKKVDPGNWTFYVNQSKNSTAGLDDATYTYFVTATSDTETVLETRTVNVGPIPPEAVPEFSDYAILLLLITTVAGFVYVRKQGY